MKRFLPLLLIFCLLLQSCAVSLSNWNRTPEDPERFFHYTQLQKENYYQQYGIADIVRSGDEFGFSTFATPDRYYYLNSFMPELTRKVSDARWHLDRVERLENFDTSLWLGFWLSSALYVAAETLAGAFDWTTPEGRQQRATVAVAIGAPALVGVSLSSFNLEQRQKAALDQLKDKYNRQLRKELGLAYSYP